MLCDCGFIGSFGKRRKLSHSNLAVTSTQTGALLPPSNVPVIKATSGSIGQPGPSATQPVTSTIAIPGQSTMSPQAALTTSTQMSTNPSTNPSAATSRQPQQSSLSTTVSSFYASFRTVIASSVAGSANVLVLPQGTNFTAPPSLGRQRSPLCRSPCCVCSRSVCNYSPGRSGNCRCVIRPGC
jgi:hypothetical protein